MSPSSSSSSTAITTTTSTGTSLVVVRAPGACPHEIRPGTTVCLHCRKEERLARMERRRRTFTRVGVTVAALGVCAVVANAAVGAFDLHLPSLAAAIPHGRATSSQKSAPRHAAANGAASGESAAPTYGATDAAAPTAPARPTVAPVVAEGRTALSRGPAVAVRAGDVVTVQFDAPDTRTRRADKFEAIVRATLPAVYGAAADSALAHVAAGALVTPSELVTELPARGVRLPIATAPASAGALVLWPETRPGRDGPLVVSYRVTVAP